MSKAINLDNLKTFLAECRKLFALKSEMISDGEVNAKLQPYAKTADVDSKLMDYVKTYEVSTKLGEYAKTADVTTRLEDYAKNDAVDSKLQKYVKTEELAVYAKKSDIAKAVNYRGSVNTYAELPKSGMAVGDMYNIAGADDSHGIRAGDNVVYNGNTWDNMGGTIDLSMYATKEELHEKMDETPFAENSDIVALFN